MRVWPGLRLIGAGGKIPKGLCGRGGSGAGRSEAGQRQAGPVLVRGPADGTQSTRYRNSRTEVETLLRQRMRGLRNVSFQLPCKEDVLPSAFEDKPLCVPWQLAELLQLSVEEVCADFDAADVRLKNQELLRGARLPSNGFVSSTR